MRYFSGSFPTTDGKHWYVCFRALNWEDAESIAETFGVIDLGVSLGGFLAEDGSEIPTTQGFACWDFRDGQFVKDEEDEL
jgi:hypothetical protein